MPLRWSLLFVCWCALCGQVPVPQRAPQIRIDGNLLESEWREASPFPLKFQFFPGNNSEPSEPTTCYVISDKANLYLGCRAQDSAPKLIRGRVQPRDEIGDDDQIQFFIDTYNDRRRAYFFALNPAGVQADGIVTDGAEDEDLTWDGIFESAGCVTANGYEIEMRIPFKTLRFQPGPGKQWGFLAQRVIARKPEGISWTPVSRNITGRLVQMGELRLEQAPSGGVVDFIPTSTGIFDTARQPDGGYNHAWRGDLGATVNWSLTPNLTLSTTLNPDFSTIETDVPQIDTNQRFRLFYPERRPFFLEGSEIFRPAQQSEAALELVNTRSIVDADWGVKLSGKTGKNSIGLLAAGDRATPDRREALVTILRFQRDLQRDSSWGAFFTERRWAGTSQQVFAADARVRLSPSQTLFAQAVHTRTRTSAKAPARHQTALTARFAHESDRWRLTHAFQHLPPGFDVWTGFVRRGDLRVSSFNQITYLIRPADEKRWFQSIEPFLEAKYGRTFAGATDESWLDPGIALRLQKAVELFAFVSSNRETFAGKTLDYRFYTFGPSIGTFKRLIFSGEIQKGQLPIYDPSRPRVGDSTQVQFTATARPFQRLRNEFRYLHLGLREMDRTVSSQSILRDRTVFQFTRFLNFRSIVEYDTSRRRWGINELLTYLPHPNTSVSVGYSDLLIQGFDRDLRNEMGGTSLIRERRLFFVRLSYNFRI